MAYSGIFVLLPLLLLPSWWLWLALAFAYLPKLYLGHMFQRTIGGYTGDCLGLAQQVSEVVFYLAVIGLWTFM